MQQQNKKLDKENNKEIAIKVENVISYKVNILENAKILTLSVVFVIIKLAKITCSE